MSTPDQCIHCKTEENLESVQLSDFNGFMHSSYSRNICDSCLQKHGKIVPRVGRFLIMPAEYVTEGPRLYCDQHGFGNFERVRTKHQLDHLFRKDYFELLKYVEG